ncbi:MULTISPECIES: hypothetical protein [unclassified Chelatococcus]|uniref:hypothetical protein n=1 Tax=unclassified Chelatococcus TaxID=2638111 RepID=UPI001BCAF635|nr:MULTISPECIES: hypothetical protein [unclassified Chelatococcus]MBS7697987.1 hypothetical protein [Chelatococcus sp. YT9]MBX3556695.1 hypothetical protein [Chelatococcus sp.]
MTIDLKETVAGVDAEPARVFSRMIKLSRGLFALRYLAADDDRKPPAIGVQTGPGSRGTLTIIGGPDSEEGFLLKPGDAAVLVSRGASLIVVTTYVRQHALSDGVKLKLDQIDRLNARDSELLRAASPHRAKAVHQERRMPVSLSGHIEGIGTLSLKAGQRLGELGSGKAIEEFAIHWPRRPVGVDIAYGCAAVGGGLAAETLTGDFVGARGAGGAIGSLFVRLVGERAGEFTLDAEAVFADGRRVVSTSQGVEAEEGPAPLVALSVAVLGPLQLDARGTLEARDEAGLGQGMDLPQETSLSIGASDMTANSIMGTSQTGDQRGRRNVGIRPGRIRLFRGMQRLAVPEAAE